MYVPASTLPPFSTICPCCDHRLHIGNLFETQWDLQTSKYSPTLLKLKKLALEEAPPEDIATRTRQVSCRMQIGSLGRR